MDALDALIAARVTKPAGVLSGDVPVWNGTTFVRPSGTPSLSAFLRGDGAWAGTYTSYTPTLSSSGGGGAVGNGTAVARYIQIGKLVHYAGRLVLGTTTTFGSGSLWVSLPVPGAANLLLIGDAYAFDFSASAIAPVVGIAVSAGVARFTGTSTHNGVGNDVSGTAPFPWSWAISDELNWNLTYEAA
jgi:hypothetical protein